MHLKGNEQCINLSRHEWDSIYGSSLLLYLRYLPQIRELGIVDHIYLAAKYNNIGIAEYIYQKHEKWYAADEKSYQVAAENGNLQFLQWLQEKGCPYQGHQTVIQSLLSGKVECLDYLLSLDSSALNNAFRISPYIGNSTVECTKLLVEKYRHPIGKLSVQMAIENKNFPLLQYLFSHIDPSQKKKEFILLAGDYGCGKIFTYLMQHCTPNTLSYSEKNKILKKARKYQYHGIISYLENQID